MPKSKNTKDHKNRLAKYKANKKIEQETFKKKMIDNYMKTQQAALAAEEAHTSTEEVIGPDIDIDGLNEIGLEEYPVDLMNPDVTISDAEIIE
jgi:hypothetical protein